MRNYTLRRTQAFTVIELLVILGVVIIVAAILFPVLASVREKGRRANCLSNQRQIALAMTQYLSDNNETFPYGRLVAPATGWAGDCMPYMKDPHLLTCPSDSTSSSRNTAITVISYALNANLGGVQYMPRAAVSTAIPSSTLLELVSPANTVMLFEASDCANDFAAGIDLASPSGNGVGVPGTAIRGTYLSGSGGQFQEGDNSVTRYATGNIGGRVLNGIAGSTPRHNGGANFVACDGHALWLTPDAISSGMNATTSACLQGTDHHQPPGCIGQHTDQAAGTASGAYVLTFSTK